MWNKSKVFRNKGLKDKVVTGKLFTSVCSCKIAPWLECPHSFKDVEYEKEVEEYVVFLPNI